jgi:formylglycine-generating enzyme required for sulfatase activity/WD40 repeat protein
MRHFIEFLHAHGGNHLNGEEIADILWLAAHLPQIEDRATGDLSTPPGSPAAGSTEKTEADSRSTGPGSPPSRKTTASGRRTGAYLSGSRQEGAAEMGVAGLPFRSPTVPALPRRLAMARSLRLLKRTAPSHTRQILDEAATVQRIADEGNWLPVLRPARERWLDLVLLADESPSMTVWHETLGDLQALLERIGAFRTVQRWGFYADPEAAGQVHFYAGSRFWGSALRFRQSHELNDPRGRRLILLVSDCVSAAWRQPAINQFLDGWRDTPVTLVQVLPERLWRRTGLRFGTEVALRSPLPGLPNRALIVRPRWQLNETSLPEGYALPVVTLEPELLALWAQGMTAKGSAWVRGVLFPRQPTPVPAPDRRSQERAAPDVPRILDAFLRRASEGARLLAGYFSAVPLNLPVMRLVQQVMFDEPNQTHLAEVLLSGLVQRRPGQSREIHPDAVEYEFIKDDLGNDAREMLNRTVGTQVLLIVLSRTSSFVAANTGVPVDFPTLLADPSRAGSLRIDTRSLPFATIAAETLQRMGGAHAELAEHLVRQLHGDTPSPVQPDILFEGMATTADSESVESGIEGIPAGEIASEMWRTPGELLQVCTGHSAGVRTVVFSADGTRLLSAGRDGTARIWQVATGEQEQVLSGAGGAVLAAAFSPDGDLLALGGEGNRVILWDSTGSRASRELLVRARQVWSVEFSPDGAQLLTADSNGFMGIWDVRSAQARGQIHVTKGEAWHAAFSPDGRRIITCGSEGGVRIWNAAEGQEIMRLPGHRAEVNQAAFAPDGQRVVTASDDGTAAIWESESGEQLQLLSGHTDWVNWACFDPTGRLNATASSDRTVGVWDSASGDLLLHLTGHGDSVASVAFSPDGRLLASGSTDATVRLWWIGDLQAVEESVTETSATVIEEQRERLPGAGIRVGVLSTGIDTSHPDFSGRIAAVRDFTRTGEADYKGYGTKIAGVVAGDGYASNGQYQGVAPGCELLIAKVLDDEGSGQLATVMEGAQWLADQEIQILLCPLGMVGTADGNDAFSRLLDSLVESGIVVIVAAGNDGKLSSPAAARRVLTVGAATRDGKVADFSGRGPTTDGRPKPDLVAQVDGIITARSLISSQQSIPDNANYTVAHDTGAAAAYVAGFAALLLEQDPSLRPDDVARILRTTAVNLGADPNAQGAGSANIERALRFLIEQSNSNPKTRPQQFQQIHNSLLDAYDELGLRHMVRLGMDVDLDRIAGGNNLRERVFNLVQWAERTGRIHDLVQVAHEHNPTNAALKKLYDFWFTPKIFLSYSPKDSESMRQVLRLLEHANLAVWTEKWLKPGTDSLQVTHDAIQDTQCMVILLSPDAKKSDWMSREMRYAQELGRPIFPVLVNGDYESSVPASLWDLQIVDARQDLADAVSYRLLPALERYLNVSGPLLSETVADTSEESSAPVNVEPPSISIFKEAPLPTPVETKIDIFDWVMIPAGEFLMGSDKSQDQDAFDDEFPQHRLYLPAYHITRTPVTVAQFEAFVQSTGYVTTAEKEDSARGWTGSKYEDEIQGANWRNPRGPGSDLVGKELHPVTTLSWHDVNAYCRWISERLGQVIRLPTEVEWEKAARGSDGLIYPWGSEEPDESHSNFNMMVGDTTPVGAYSRGASPYGCLDMAGNVWEWTSSSHGTYPYNVVNDGREDPEANGSRVLRGGSFGSNRNNIRCAIRLWNDPLTMNNNVGFRVVSLDL